MNKIIQAIKERRSIRKYKKEQIDDNELLAILEAATFAPADTTTSRGTSWLFRIDVL